MDLQRFSFFLIINRHRVGKLRRTNAHLKLPRSKNIMQKYIFTLVLSVLVLAQFEKANCQTFIRDCNNPLIQNHLTVFGHTYCFHACNDLVSNTGPPTCTAGGACVCPCNAPGPDPTFSSDTCPPRAADAPDPDPTALPQCISTCAAACPGGQGEICGEVAAAILGSNTYAKICTCVCPRPCTTTTTTTTTTMAPTTTTTTQVSIIPFFIKPLLIKKVNLILTKLVIYGLIIFGTVLKALIVKTAFVFGFLVPIFFVFSYIQSMFENMMYDYVMGMVRMGTVMYGWFT